MKEYKLCNSISDDFMYVYSPACKYYKEFIVEDDCIHNTYNDELQDWDYVSMVSKKRYSVGTKITTKCSFAKFGAPLIVFSDDISKDENGRNIYGHHYEIVAYEDGINIWSIVRCPERKEKPIFPTKVGSLSFHVDENTLIELEVTVEKGKIIAKLCGQVLEVTYSEIPEKFHVGITACEGDNRFTELKIEGE